MYSLRVCNGSLRVCMLGVGKLTIDHVLLKYPVPSFVLLEHDITLVMVVDVRCQIFVLLSARYSSLRYRR